MKKKKGIVWKVEEEETERVMAEHNHSNSSLQPILDLLFAAGYVESDAPPSQIIAGGISWAVAALNANTTTAIYDESIEDSLRLVGCPHLLLPSHIRDLDTEALLPVVQWLTSRIPSHHVNEVCDAENAIEVDEHGTSIEALSGNLDELNHRKMNAVEQLDQLRERISKEGVDSGVQKLISSMMSLKDLERQESRFLFNRDSKHSELQAEISELERKRENDTDSQSLPDGLHQSLSESLEKINLMKKKLAARLRDIVVIRRQIDDLPCQSELNQYESRLSELNDQIQGKHRQTRKYYATYNALLEIKEMMLKETSLLNSIISQFQDAFSSTDGRIRLVHSMEGIVNGSQQKLEKVQVGLQEEEKIRNDLKDRYAAAIGEQKRCYSLMKAFQVKCQSSK